MAMRCIAVDGNECRELTEGWELASSLAGEHPDSGSIDRLRWQQAIVPGTVGASVAGGSDLDERDWWFRTRFDAPVAAAPEQVVLTLEGLATVAEVYLNGRKVLASESMFVRHELDVGAQLRGSNELAIAFRALGPLLAVPRRPRARWRTRLVPDGNLRFFRTMLLGRAPGFAPGPPAIGPWAPIRLEHRRRLLVDELSLRPRLSGADGILALSAELSPLRSEHAPRRVVVEVTGAGGSHSAELVLEPHAPATIASGEIRVADAELWWPHTHGSPSLYEARMLVLGQSGETIPIDLGRVGFRGLDAGKDIGRDGLRITLNGVDVFARGAVWTPLDLARPLAEEGPLRRALGEVVEAGMNMLRVPGTGCYESDRFYELCDELGILVWQDFMFANLDYPEQDSEFMSLVEQETRAVLARLVAHPSVTVLCGGSEVAQQAAMVGVDPGLANSALYGQLLPSLIREATIDAAYVPSTPWGGDLPFRPSSGVAHYYGVGAYLRGFEDVRRSNVRFAAECLAFSNVPDGDADADATVALGDPSWKRGVPRDAGAGWDFEDVRDHYLAQLFEVDPVSLRWSDQERYLELSRAVTGEVMSEVFGEWRRAQSSCAGALVVWLTDLLAGPGWGVTDHRGRSKVAYHYLRRALAPIAVWSTDEGLDGVAVHVANDGPHPLSARLRIALYRDLELRVEEIEQQLELRAHSAFSANVEVLLGRFVDAAWAYRFGPPAQDLIVMSLERMGDGPVKTLSQSFRLPAGRPKSRESAEQLGLRAAVETEDGDRLILTLEARRFVYGVRIHVPGFAAGDDSFSLEPGRCRELELVRGDGSTEPLRGAISALNLRGRVPLVIGADR